MERDFAFWKERGESELMDVGGFAENAPGFFAPTGVKAGFLEFLLDERKSLQKKLTLIGKGESIPARDMASELTDQDLAEGDVDGGRGLEIADGVKDVGGDDVATGDAARL